jgi:hypothetical protein
MLNEPNFPLNHAQPTKLFSINLFPLLYLHEPFNQAMSKLSDFQSIILYFSKIEYDLNTLIIFVYLADIQNPILFVTVGIIVC